MLIFIIIRDMGAGKTCFARSFIRQLKNDPNMVVTSPSYLLDNTYDCNAKKWCVDTYSMVVA
jgi:tRNA A37 threonylcarbamoyladenosine biosynthesis protein TsaE